MKTKPKSIKKVEKNRSRMEKKYAEWSISSLPRQLKIQSEIFGKFLFFHLFF